MFAFLEMLFLFSTIQYIFTQSMKTISLEEHQKRFNQSKNRSLVTLKYIKALEKEETRTRTLSNNINEIIGSFDNEGLNYSADGIFSTLVHVYHSRLIEDGDYFESVEFGGNISIAEEEIRLVGIDLEFVKRYKKKCQRYVNIKNKTDMKEQYGDYLFDNNINIAEGNSIVFQENLLPKFEILDKRIKRDCITGRFREAKTNLERWKLYVYNNALYAAFTQMYIIGNWDIKVNVNFRKPNKNYPIGVISRMLLDVEESLHFIENSLDQINTYVQSKEANNNPQYASHWKKLKTKFEIKISSVLYKPWFKKLTGAIDTYEIVYNGKLAFKKLAAETLQFLSYHESGLYLQFHKNPEEFKNRINEVDPLLFELRRIFNEYFKVIKISQEDECGNLYKFDRGKPLQNLRYAWICLDKFAEELKCYLKKSYWFDKRNKTLLATQMKMQRLFHHVSHTLYQPCRVTDDNLMSGCTAANHEICRPMIMMERQQEKIQRSGELSIYKPKWIFKRTGKENNEECSGRLTYVIPTYLCRCGFILDCGEKLTCVLQENDNVRKQCKGSVGYPCKNLPMAPKRHHESCASGYCDPETGLCNNDRRRFIDTKKQEL